MTTYKRRLSSSGERRGSVVEQHGIDHVPESERHGLPRQQFNIWFAVNMNPIAIVVGSLAAASGLGWTESIIIYVVATTVGAIGVGLAAAMGPKLGAPQMTISRLAFGRWGNYLPAVLATLLFIGYFTTTAILATETVQQLVSVPYTLMAVIVCAVSVALTIFGYDLVHWLERWLTPLAILVFAALTITALITHPRYAGLTPVTGAKNLEKALLVFGAIFSYAVGWSPYASDYSRYMPRDTPWWRTLLFSGLGLITSVLWMEILGYAIGRLSYSGGITDGIRTLVPLLAVPAFVLIILVSVVGCVMNAYSGAMSGIAWRMPLSRTAATIVIGAIGTILTIAFGGPRFEPTLEKFLFLVAYFVTPWLAVLATDFYALRRTGRVLPPARDLYSDDGVIGRVRWRGLLAFLIGFGVSVPFMATDLYTGPVGRALGGADISYLVSAAVAGVVYWLMQHVKTHEPAQVRQPGVSAGGPHGR